MKTRSLKFLAIAITGMCLFSCTSEFEDEVRQAPATRDIFQFYSPDVLVRACELGIIIANEKRQWNNLTDEDVIFYLDLLTEKGDSAFIPSVSQVFQPWDMVNRMSILLIEDIGSTVQDHTWMRDMKIAVEGVNLRLCISLSWNLNRGKASNIEGSYSLLLNKGKEKNWDVGNFSGTMNTSASGEEVAYEINGYFLLERHTKDGTEYKNLRIQLSGTTADNFQD